MSGGSVPVPGGDSSKKPQSGPVVGGHPRSTGTGTGTTPDGLTCELVLVLVQFQLELFILFRFGRLTDWNKKWNKVVQSTFKFIPFFIPF